MAIAGKVAITPGGEWSVDIAYDKLVVVTFGNNVYLSIKPSTGIEPTNEEYWMLLIENVTQEQYDNIINGTTPVGNANTVQGYAPNAVQLTGTDGSQLANHHMVFQYNADGNGRFNAVTNTGHEISVNHANYATNAGALGGKSASEYFLKSGGDIDGTLHARGATDTPIYNHANSSTDESYIGYAVGDTLRGYIGFKNGKAHIHNVGDIATTADLANYLPLDGGFLTKTGASTILALRRTDADEVRLQYSGATGVLGYLGFVGSGNPVYIQADATTAHSLLHTGNKPRGSYTGNGSATKRTISTNGLGNGLLIWSDNGSCLVSPHGTIIKVTSGTTVSGLVHTAVSFAEGVLTIASTSEYVNNNGVTYYYQVL